MYTRMLVCAEAWSCWKVSSGFLFIYWSRGPAESGAHQCWLVQLVSLLQASLVFASQVLGLLVATTSAQLLCGFWSSELCSSHLHDKHFTQKPCSQSNNTFFEVNFIYYYCCVCFNVYVCVCMYHGMRVEARGHVCWDSSLLPAVLGFWGLNSGCQGCIVSGSKHVCPLSHLLTQIIIYFWRNSVGVVWI